MFDTLTTPQMIFISAIMASTLWAGIRMRSAVSIGSWVLLLLALVGILQFDMPIRYFFFSLIFEGIAIGISMFVFVFQQENI